VVGDEVADTILGQPVTALFEEEVFAPGGALRHVLEKRRLGSSLQKVTDAFVLAVEPLRTSH
jgi:hypothetical protein